jgi:gluconolactonase
MSGYEVIAEGLAFPEGPVVMADGSVIVVEILAGKVTRCWPGGRETVAEPGGGPNGAAIGPDGALWVCNSGGLAHGTHARGPGRIECIDLATGRVERIYDSCEGAALSAPNDLMFDIEGNFWFTDLGRFNDSGKDFGGLYCARADGSGIARIKAGAISYNGVGISPDMSTVYVSDTYQARVYAFDRRAEPQEPRLLATVPGMTMLDSLAMTAAGNVCVTMPSAWGVATVTQSGAVTVRKADDLLPTNIAFGGADMHDAWLTFSDAGTLVKTRWDEPGLPLVYNA